MNRFIIVALVVAGIFVLPYLLWEINSSSPYYLSSVSEKQLHENTERKDGWNWLIDYQNMGPNKSGIELTILTESVTQQDLETILKETDQKKLVVASFPYAKPENENVRKEMNDLFGVRQTGWVMKQFKNLSKVSNKEVPEWVNEYDIEPKNYSGPGWMLINERLHKLVMIETDQLLTLTDGDKTYDTSFADWIELVEPLNTNQELSWFKVPSDDGILDKFRENDIPIHFPAIIDHSFQNVRYVYLTGDYQQLQSPPGLYKIAAIDRIYSQLYKKRADGFYWNVFLSEMQSILSETENWQPKKVTANKQLTYHSKIKGNRFEVYEKNKWQTIPIKGVNIGMGKPGYFPGEAAITEEEYARWFQQIGDMNANTIRVYTIQPPGFYRALKTYNETHEQKLYVFHGVWVEEEVIDSTKDAFNPETMKLFEEEYRHIVDIIHGDARVEPKAGHASGVYDADISDYVIGWIMGIEWYPEMVVETNKKYAQIGDYEGRYVQTKQATPFEHWLALHLDEIVSYEMTRYNEIRPVSFTNWVTTDLLTHPSEPLLDEDLVGVNPNVIYVKSDLQKVGQFASYHVYPYYPDFFNVDKTYGEYVDQDGQRNRYAGYLNALKKAHRMPVLVAEFGIPASRGQTHRNPYGWNQGFMSEKAQGETLAKLYRTILAEDYLGGLVFSWQDEWFKRTWNTLDYDNPERRPYWGNVQTNEQNFGLMGFASHQVQVDGNIDEWDKSTFSEQNGNVSLSVNHDENYLYVNIQGIESSEKVNLLFDTIAGQGNQKIAIDSKWNLSNTIDFVAKFGENEGHLLIDPYYDFFHFLYGNDKKMIPPASTGKQNVETFIPIEYVLNKRMYYPELNETREFQSYETGLLRRGNANPDSPNYDSLADYEWKGNTLEVRIPWLLLQFRDPSRKEIIGDLFKDGLGASETIDSIGIGVVVEDESGNISSSIPEARANRIPKLPTYTWENWDIPTSKERLKQSYYTLQQLFETIE